MSNIVIPYRGLLTQLDSGPYEPPLTDMIGRWKAEASYLRNAENSAQPTTNGEKISRWNGDQGGASMRQTSNGAMPIWCDGTADSSVTPAIPAGLNGYPYVWFNYDNGETWLEASSSFYGDDNICTMYYVMDTHSVSQTGGYDSMVTNYDDYYWSPGGWRIGSDNNGSTDLASAVGDWGSRTTVDLASSWTNPRVFCLKWQGGSSSYSPTSRFGMTGGGGLNYFTWGSATGSNNPSASNYDPPTMSGHSTMLWGTGRDFSSNAPQGNVNMVIYEAYFYDVYHSDTTSQAIMTGLKNKFGTS